jgi:hypothetical protein
MKFQWLRALLIEDNVIAQSVFIAGLALWYESAAHSVGNAMPMISVILLGGGTLFVLSIHLFKRARRSRAQHKN